MPEQKNSYSSTGTLEMMGRLTSYLVLLGSMLLPVIGVVMIVISYTFLGLLMCHGSLGMKTTLLGSTNSSKAVLTMDLKRCVR
jgi:hypothetical protein